MIDSHMIKLETNHIYLSYLLDGVRWITKNTIILPIYKYYNYHHIRHLT